MTRTIKASEVKPGMEVRWVDEGRSKGREETALEANFGVIETAWNPYEGEEA